MRDRVTWKPAAVAQSIGHHMNTSCPNQVAQFAHQHRTLYNDFVATAKGETIQQTANEPLDLSPYPNNARIGESTAVHRMRSL